MLRLGRAADLPQIERLAADSPVGVTALPASRERLAAEVAERFALDHQGMDDELFGRLRAEFTDPEILELVTTCGFCVGLGRVLQVPDVDRDFDVLWSREPGEVPRRPPDGVRT